MTQNYRTIAKAGRAIIAIAAAYAFALQVLLLSLTASQAAAIDPTANPYAICFGAGDNATADTPSGPATKKIHCSLVCAQAMSATAPAPSATLSAVFATNSTQLERTIRPARAITASPSPRLSQGPPRIA